MMREDVNARLCRFASRRIDSFQTFFISMSIAKRRKRTLKRKKNKLRKLLHRNQRRLNRELLHSDLLYQFSQFIEDEFQRGEITLYRWSHNPIIGDDFLPQIFQSTSDIDITDVEVPSPTDSKKKIKHYVNYFTLSHFISEQQAVDEYNRIKDNILNSDHPERIEGFIENKGSYVQKVDYEEDDIMYAQPDQRGHINTLPCVGMDPQRVIDTTYIPVKLI